MAAVRNKSNNEISLTYSVHVQQMVADNLIFPETFLRMATDDSVNSGDICRRHFNAVLILQKCCENCFQLTLWMHLIYVTFHMLQKKYDCKRIVLLLPPTTLIAMHCNVESFVQISAQFYSSGMALSSVQIIS